MLILLFYAREWEKTTQFKLPFAYKDCTAYQEALISFPSGLQANDTGRKPLFTKQ